MAWERPHGLVTKIAKADLSGQQYRFVKLDPTDNMGCLLAGAGEAAHGVLQNKPSLGLPGTVATGGDSKVIAGGTIDVNDMIAADASGRAVLAAAGNVILGVCELAATVGLVTTVKLTIGQAKA